MGVPITLHIQHSEISFIVLLPGPLNVLLILDGDITSLHLSRVPNF